MIPRGAYPADRAAALSGVPLSTVHWWARNDVLMPSISAERIKLWSYSDLMGLRIIYWLRQTKTAPDGAAVPRTAMPAVRRAQQQIAELDLRLWSEDTGPGVSVDRGGNVIVLAKPDAEAPHRQRTLAAGYDDLLSVTDPFLTAEGFADRTPLPETSGSRSAATTIVPAARPVPCPLMTPSRRREGVTG